jgi:spore coat protein U-like protein
MGVAVIDGRRVPWVPVLGVLVFLAIPSTLRAGCTVSTSGVAFGSYSVFDFAATNSTGTISYSCTLPVNPPVIRLSRGNSSTFFPRAMSKVGDTLAYNLFLDAPCTTVWGDGTSGTSVYSAGPPADGLNYIVTIYGRIPARQNVRGGHYSDSIVVAIDF